MLYVTQFLTIPYHQTPKHLLASTKKTVGVDRGLVRTRVREIPFEEFKTRVCDTIKCAETGMTRTKIAKDLRLESRDDPLLIKALGELVRDSRIELHAYRYTSPWMNKKAQANFHR